VSLDTDQKGGDIELTYLIDIGLWQAMLDSLSEQLGAGIRIVSQSREVILQSGLAALCREGMKHKAKHPACFRCCDIADLATYDQPGFALCPYCDRAINFVFNLRTDSIEGHVIIGPVWIAEKGSRPTLARLARKFGVGLAKFSQLSAKVRSYTLEEFRKAGEMVFSTMQVVAQTLGANLQLVNELEQVKESLAIEKKKTWQKMIRDPLTGVYRYNYGLARLKQEVARAERYQQSLSIVVISIEQVRSYVDRYGRDVMRALLKDILNLLQKRCRRTDLPVQLSDERFLLILPFTAEEGAQVVLDRIRGEVEAISVSDEEGAAIKPPSLAEGLASYPKDGQRGRELLNTALERMRQ
jgi:diguanylate cyclase (GGDEF)-like protein